MKEGQLKNLASSLVRIAVLGVACLAAQAASAGDTKIGGKVFTDLSYMSVKDGADNKVNGTGTGFDVKRFYVNIGHDLDDTWSLNFTSDIGDANGAYDMFVKKAYLQAKLPNNAAFRAGAAELPWVSAVEDLYGYRYVENVLIDRLKFGTSTDWGLHLLGKGADGKFNYQISAVNGGGYKKPARSKNMDVEGRVGIMPVPGLTLAVGGYAGKLGKVQQTTATSQTASRFDVVGAYTQGPVHAGAEFLYASKWNQVLTTASDKTNGFSAWASGELTPEWSLFGRYDWDKPSKDLDSGFKEQYMNVGLQYAVSKDVVVAPVFKYDKREKSATAANNGKSQEFGLWAQAKF